MSESGLDPTVGCRQDSPGSTADFQISEFVSGIYPAFHLLYPRATGWRQPEGRNAQTDAGVFGGLGGKAERLEVSEAVEMVDALRPVEVGPATLWLVVR